MVATDGDAGGVRVVPPIVEFVDALENKQYSLKFTVQNVSKFGRRMRFHPPVTNVSILFCLLYFILNN